MVGWNYGLSAFLDDKSSYGVSRIAKDKVKELVIETTREMPRFEKYFRSKIPIVGEELEELGVPKRMRLRSSFMFRFFKLNVW